jgi:signal transduction histidine kinase
LLGLVKQLLDHARIEAGEQTVEAETVLLAELLEESLVLVRPLAEQKGLRLRIEAPQLPMYLRTDPGKVRQILVNVLANAVKFSEHGDIVVLVRLDALDGSERVVFEVTDQGTGIAAEHHEHVFEPFWRVDPLSKQSGDGTGLGLAVSRQLARFLGGEVRVTASALGEGSTFVVSLPQRVVPTRATPHQDAPALAT